MSSNVKNILKTYLRRLTNLNSNNRSLFLPRLRGDQLIDLQDLSYLDGEQSFDIIRSLIGRRSRTICKVLDTRMEANNKVSRRLTLLNRADRFFYEESGARDLHVGWPFVRGRFSNGVTVRCPLLFFPVSLVVKDNNWILQLREDAGISFNKSFLMAYSFYNKVPLEEELLETNFEDFDTDTTVFRTELYQLLKNKIELHFNPDNFRDELQQFEELNKPELEEKFPEGSLRLFPEAVLGIFPQTDSRLVEDYLHMIDNGEFQDLEEFFVACRDLSLDPNQPGDAPREIREENLFAPFHLDGSQEHAIRTIKSGNSIVVQGPPGTGKSQLIANLIADGIASGKRVLLVCQKRVALDVVYERLSSLQIADFLGIVHDHRNDRKEVFEKIKKQIDGIEDFKARNRSIDVIYIERRFAQICRRIDQLVEELQEFWEALYSEKECGISAKELYLTSDPSARSVNLKQLYRHYEFAGINDFMNILRRYVAYARTFELESYPWKERISFAEFSRANLKTIQSVVNDVVAVGKEVVGSLASLVSSRITFDDAIALREQKREAFQMIDLLQNDEIYRYFQIIAQFSDDETSALWFSNIARVCMNCFEGVGVERSVPTHQLGEVQKALRDRMKARTNFIRKVKWDLMSPHKQLLKRVLASNDLSGDKNGMLELERKIDNRLNLEHHITAIRGMKWLTDFPRTFRKEDIGRWFETRKGALEAKLIFSTLHQIRGGIEVREIDREKFIRIIRSVFEVIEELPERKAGWLRYLSPYQVRQLLEQPDQLESYVSTLKRDFDSLCEFDSLKKSIKSHDVTVIESLIESVGEWDISGFEAVFQNSLRLAWLDHIETKFPVLRIASTLRLGQLEEELRTLTDEKRKLSRDILLVKAREKIYEGIEYNRLNNRITYRDLYHQVSKKRKLWPLRKVVAEFSDELFRLVPCWMASPESVSALFPMKELFDLVLFDEASQCFSERGLPAMYRGKQLLIAGDSKQLRPSSLYRVRWEEEGEDPDLEADSLLELAGRYLPSVNLREHYRSQSYELIDFSNRNFYSGRLKMLPDRELYNMHVPAIAVRRVDGCWEGQTNQVEAEEVARLVWEIAANEPDKSVGIITFNSPQQTLIQDLLEAGAAAHKTPASIFVKNIENVQGDEKDIIIFSIGYAKDKKGKLTIQFGSLNVDGGENRLNVAITRARERIIIVSSIGPEDLKTEDAKNSGPRLLKQYLQYATTVSGGTYVPSASENPEYRDNWYLKKCLEKNNDSIESGRLTISQFAYCDVLVWKDDQVVGALLTDDENYHQVYSVKEPHSTILRVLEKKKWPYQRVYSRNFWSDREEFLTTLTKSAFRFEK